MHFPPLVKGWKAPGQLGPCERVDLNRWSLDCGSFDHRSSGHVLLDRLKVCKYFVL
jgi:hypothetical protein